MSSILQWLTTLVSFDTTSRNSNLALIDCVQKELEQFGWIGQRTYDATKQKSNLFATLPSEKEAKKGGLILSGHTDVVPVDGQAWQTPPFQAIEQDGRIYGRGTSDMKGFLAVIMSLLPEFKELKLQRPLHLAFSFDEEVGCRGVPLLIEQMKKSGIKPAECVIGEPTGMELLIANKGIYMVQCRIHGHTAHSSLTPQGCNAIEHAARLVTYLRHIADELRRNGPSDPLFEIPFVSLSTNQVQGGIAINTIPALCELSFEFRPIPGFDSESVLQDIKRFIQEQMIPAMRRENGQSTVEIEVLTSVPSFQVEPSTPLVRKCCNALRNPRVYKASYTTEAGIFQQAGIETVICGPGNIQQAHKANEFIRMDELTQCRDFLRKIVSQG